MEIRQVKFPDWQIETRRGTSKGLSDTYCWREKVRCRKVKVVADMRVEEGIVLRYEERVCGSKEPYSKEHNQHMVGYHYVSFIDAQGKDVFWFQKCGKGYRFFYNGTAGEIRDFVNFEYALMEFNRLLKEKWSVEVVECEV